jgi:phosphate-selective porin OprO/OprP
MKLRNTITTMMTIGAILPTSAFAATISDEEAAALLERLKKLEQEVIVLKDKLASENSEQQVEKTSIAETKNSSKPKKTNSVNWKGAPEVKSSDGWSVKPRGRLLYDFANLSSVPDSMDIPGEGFSNEARRIRLGIQGTMPGGFGYKLETDLSGGSSLTDAYVDYKNDGLKVVIGQHNNFQGLEELSSSNDTSFIERAAFTDAFGFQRKVGVSAAFKAASLNFQAGIFTDNIDDLDDGNNSFSVDARVFSSPKIDDMQMHFGGSVHQRDLGDGFDSVRYRARPMVHSVDTRFINTNNIAGANKESSYGLEAAVISGRFHAAAEMHSVTIDRTGFEDPTFFGGAIEAGFYLTNDTRQYKGGVFKGVKVSEPLGTGGIGAWQVNVRFDRLDLDDAGIVGGTQDAYMASLIWTPINNVRFLVNYGHLSYSNALGIVEGAPDDFSVNVWGARTQVSF